MTSEPSAEPRTSMLGRLDSLTAGNATPLDIAQTVIGKLGDSPDLGFLERALAHVLLQNGTPREYTRAIAREIMVVTFEWFQDSLELLISDTANQRTEPKKPENTSTSESQNEEVG